MIRISMLLIVCVLSLAAFAQNTKFGKPSKLDWDMQVWGEAPDAEAVILCKTLEVNYTLASDFNSYESSNSDLSSDNVSVVGVNRYVNSKMTSLLYKVKMRTKILKDSGSGYANVDIVYYSNEEDMNDRDEINEMSVVVFNQVDGKVKKTKLGRDNYKDERLSDKFMVRHIRVPEAKAGCIIEYQYELFSGRAPYIYDWYVQDDIPTMYTSCVMNIPYFLNFNMEVPTIANVKSNVKLSSVMVPQKTSDLSAPKSCKSNYYTITSHDLVPWKQMVIDNKSISDMVKEPFKVHATIRNFNVSEIVQLPEGKRHIMINP